MITQEWTIRIHPKKSKTKEFGKNEFEKVFKENVRIVVTKETMDKHHNPVELHYHGYVEMPAEFKIKTIRERIKATPWYKSLPEEERGNGAYSLGTCPKAPHKTVDGYLRYIHKESKEGFDVELNTLCKNNFTDEEQIQLNKDYWLEWEKLKEEKKQKTVSANTCKQFLEFVEDKYTYIKQLPTGADQQIYKHPNSSDLVLTCSEYLDSINSSYITDPTYVRLINYIEFKKNRAEFNNRMLDRILNKI